MTQQRPRVGTKEPAGKASRLERDQGAAAARYGSAEQHYASIREELERRHYGSYVMINVDTLQYVIAGTASATHAKFIKMFGENQHGWCTRIGVSAFATA